MSSVLASGSLPTLSSLFQLLSFFPPPGLNPSPTVLLPPSQSPTHTQFAFTINLIYIEHPSGGSWIMGTGVCYYAGLW